MKFPAFEAIDLRNKSEPITIVELPLSEIYPCADQPRKVFQEEELQELANSIKIHGILQPIIVKRGINNEYKIIAGERRWRASKLAGKSTILAIIRPEYEESQEHMAVSLIENIQREPLNPLELAIAFSRLHKEHGLSHEEIGKLVGKNRATVSNFIRLLTLSEPVQALLINNKIDIGHAKALMTLSPEQQVDFVNLVVNENLSVREAEQRVRLYKKNLPIERNFYDDMACCWEQKISDRLSTKVRVSINEKGSGKLTTYFSSVEEGNKLLDLLLSDVS